MKIVRVDWYDARSVDGWCQAKDFSESLSLIQSCGFLFKENNDALFVSACATATVEENDAHQFCCTIVIPKKMIQNIWDITGDVTLHEQ